MESCENCGKPIGKLETPFVWQDHAVCAECHEKLARPDDEARPGIPIQPVVSVQGREVQTIEQTGKHWKAAKLIGAVLIVGGIWLGCSGYGTMLDRPLYLYMIFFGLASLVYGFMGGWWEHG